MSRNKLDQVPKNTEARYQARIDAIAKEIEAAFDRYTDLMKGDDVNNWPTWKT